MLFVNILCLRGYHDHESTSCQVVDKSRSLTRFHSTVCTTKRKQATKLPLPPRLQTERHAREKWCCHFAALFYAGVCWVALHFRFRLPLHQRTHTNTRKCRKFRMKWNMVGTTNNQATTTVAGCIFYFTKCAAVYPFRCCCCCCCRYAVWHSQMSHLHAAASSQRSAIYVCVCVFV